MAMSDRESLRPVIADLLDGLAMSATQRSHGELWSLMRGAETLRWTHAYEETPTGDEVTELEHLRELVGGIESALDDGHNPHTGKARHPGVTLSAVRNLIEANR